jgi:hypothetical protein
MDKTVRHRVHAMKKQRRRTARMKRKALGKKPEKKE